MAIRIIWDKQALENIANALEWISKESIPQAANVENAILEKIEELPNHPEKYPPDKFNPPCRFWGPNEKFLFNFGPKAIFCVYLPTGKWIFRSLFGFKSICSTQRVLHFGY